VHRLLLLLLPLPFLVVIPQGSASFFAVAFAFAFLSVIPFGNLLFVRRVAQSGARLSRTE
jgi:hypothetical protein